MRSDGSDFNCATMKINGSGELENIFKGFFVCEETKMPGEKVLFALKIIAQPHVNLIERFI